MNRDLSYQAPKRTWRSSLIAEWLGWPYIEEEYKMAAIIAIIMHVMIFLSVVAGYGIGAVATFIAYIIGSVFVPNEETRRRREEDEYQAQEWLPQKNGEN